MKFFFRAGASYVEVGPNDEDLIYRVECWIDGTWEMRYRFPAQQSPVEKISLQDVAKARKQTKENRTT